MAAKAEDKEPEAPEEAPLAAAKPGTAGLWSRRDFFGRLSWSGFGIVSLIGTLAAVRSAFPRVLFTPPQTFKAGIPTDFTIGEISEKFKREHRVWIIRDDEGIYALFAKCTHLGCTPRWLKAEDKFKCPCHGSGFYKTGVNFEGPAPRPLERYRVTLAEDGQLVVDMSVKYLFEKGEWTKAGAYLRV